LRLSKLRANLQIIEKEGFCASRESQFNHAFPIVREALGIINVCKTVLAGRGKEQHPVDNQSIAITQMILREAKIDLPDDKVIGAVNQEPPVRFWATLQTAMKMVEKSIPSPESVSLCERMNAN
jgi:hypothetical protein